MVGRSQKVNKLKIASRNRHGRTNVLNQAGNLGIIFSLLISQYRPCKILLISICYMFGVSKLKRQCVFGSGEL